MLAAAIRVSMIPSPEYKLLPLHSSVFCELDLPYLLWAECLSVQFGKMPVLDETQWKVISGLVYQQINAKVQVNETKN